MVKLSVAESSIGFDRNSSTSELSQLREAVSHPVPSADCRLAPCQMPSRLLFSFFLFCHLIQSIVLHQLAFPSCNRKPAATAPLLIQGVEISILEKRLLHPLATVIEVNHIVEK